MTIAKNKFGQYFTPDLIANFMIELADFLPDSRILETSCGKGVFLKLLYAKNLKNISAFEIDDTLSQEFSVVRYESFVSAKINSKFDLIIGNPPYIRWKNLEPELKSELASNQLWQKYCNSLSDYLSIFIIKSIELLEDNGQLVFITPEYWMSTTHATDLRNFIISNGYFESIYHFNETPIFDQANVSLIIFKFIKAPNPTKKPIRLVKYYSAKKLNKQILDNFNKEIEQENSQKLLIPQFKINQRWILQSDKVRHELSNLEQSCSNQKEISSSSFFDLQKQSYNTIGEFCDIGNGMVSGLDRAFQINFDNLTADENKATLNVVKAKNLKPFFAESITKYIYTEQGLEKSEFKTKYPNFYNQLHKYKIDLDKRYKYNRKINYWEWVFLRNLKLFSSQDKRIFVPCKERISNKIFFRFALVDANIFPTQDVTAIFKKPEVKESIEYFLAYLNNPAVFDWLRCNGTVKGSIVEFCEKPIASIPFRAIDWSNPQEVDLHNNITNTTKQYLLTNQKEDLTKINSLLKTLLNLNK